MLVCLKYCLSHFSIWSLEIAVEAHARTLEKSAEGDITKLSLLLDHDIRFCMLESSSILRHVNHFASSQHIDDVLIQLMDKSCLHHFGLL